MTSLQVLETESNGQKQLWWRVCLPQASAVSNFSRTQHYRWRIFQIDHIWSVIWKG